MHLVDEGEREVVDFKWVFDRNEENLEGGSVRVNPCGITNTHRRNRRYLVDLIFGELVKSSSTINNVVFW